MDEQSTRGQRPWGYDAFINELKPLIDEVKFFELKDRAWESDRFKVWRHKISSLCHKIDRSHVDSNCGIDLRQFRVMWSTPSAYGQTEAFDRDMRDTITELEHIVQQYDKFGEPMMKNTAAARAMKPAAAVAVVEASIEAVAQSETEWPSHLTMKWLWEHMPASAYAWVGGLVCASFLGGVAVGSWPVLQKWMEPAPVASAPAKAIKP